MNVPAGAGDSAYVYGKPRRKREPRRSCYLAPATGEDTAVAFDAAIGSLYAAKGFVEGDVAGRLHLVASLLAEACSRLPGAVAEARAEGLSWAEVADLLGVTRASAWQRYAGARPNASAEEG
jgi:DNA-directed RNA polymerase specialized sigma24 family protein